tara:strand:- start:248 stop:529 length:282 start_codon:yes stop_codon:yes gene_type:complete
MAVNISKIIFSSNFKKFFQFLYSYKNKMILVIMFSFYSKNIYAYIDPSIFSFLWQGIVLVLASAAVSIKIFWNKITEIYQILKTKLKGKKAEK